MERTTETPATDQELVDVAHRAAWGAYAEILASRAPLSSRWASPVLDSESRLLLWPACDHILFNRARADHPEVVTLATSIFRRYRVPQFLVSVSQATYPRAFRLGRSTGLVRFRRPWVLMASRLDAPSDDTLESATKGMPDDIRIEPLEVGQAQRSAQMLSRGFEMPPSATPLWLAATSRHARGFQTLGAWRGGELVGVGVLHVRADAAYLAGGVVTPAYRRRGVQRALVRARVQLARELGARVVVSETGMPMGTEPNPSFDNLRGAGLRVVEVTEHLCPPGTSW